MSILTLMQRAFKIPLVNCATDCSAIWTTDLEPEEFLPNDFIARHMALRISVAARSALGNHQTQGWQLPNPSLAAAKLCQTEFGSYQIS